MIVLRPFSRTLHQETIFRWWKEREGLDMPTEIISDQGLIGFSGDEAVAALFYYPTVGSSMVFVGWPVSDPKSDKEARSECLDMMFSAVSKIAENLGYKLLWTMSGVPVVQERLLRHGYILGDENVNQYWGRAGA